MSDEQNKSAFNSIKEGVEKNSTDSPQLSIDPATDRVAVVGDPNDVKPTNGNYKLSFRFSEDEVTDADKAKMEKDETTGEYKYSVTYEGKRVKPLYREKITLIVADLFDKLGIVTADGYTVDNLRPDAGAVLIENIEQVATIAQLTCGIPKEQMENLDPQDLALFIQQFLTNEPNILKEAVVFLVQRLRLLPKSEPAEATTPQNTPQN